MNRYARTLRRATARLAATGVTLGLLCAVAFAQAPPAGGQPEAVSIQSLQGWATKLLEQSPRRQEWVSIPLGEQTLKAWVDYPQVQGKVPVVLVLHEVFGLTDSTRNTADRIAAMGYIAITPDMLSGLGPEGGGTSAFSSSRSASQVLTGLTDEVVNARLDAWADYARSLPGSNGQLAIVGLSWGGGAAFRYAATPRSDLKLVCVFYDVGPPTVTQGPHRETGTTTFAVTGIRVPVYGFYGETDRRVMNSLAATKDAMAAAGKAYDPVVYAGADHAYMRVGEDPSNGNPANVVALKSSLERLRNLLKKALQ